MCPNCGSDDVDLVELLDDGRRSVQCLKCGQQWARGEAKRVYRTTTTYDDLRRRFPGPEDVPKPARLTADALKEQFLQANPVVDPSVVSFWQHYQKVFSRDGLITADPQDFKNFANSSIGANPGNMSVFNTAWNEMGSIQGARRVREAIEYLLYAGSSTYLEDRLTNLIQGDQDFGMTGFREALLTKVLCIVQPDRFIPILKYTGVAGKKEIAERLYQLHLPDPQRVSWTIGRLIIWSNDLLRELIGDGFVDMQHAASYLWWAKDHADPGAPATDA